MTNPYVAVMPGLNQDPNDPYTKREAKYDASGGPAEFEKYREHIQRCTLPPPSSDTWF